MTDDEKGTLIKLQTTLELGFKRIDEKLDNNKEEYSEKCQRLETRLDKHETIINKITKRVDGMSWKVVGWVMAGVAIPVFLTILVTKLL